jgi:hypothetical protein
MRNVYIHIERGKRVYSRIALHIAPRERDLACDLLCAIFQSVGVPVHRSSPAPIVSHFALPRRIRRPACRG